MGKLDIIEMIKEQRIEDAFALSRYYYRFGLETIPDSLYDTIEKFVKQQYPENELLKQTYDDDPIPRKLLVSIGEHWEDVVGDSEDFYDDMNDEKSFSIKSVSGYQQAWQWVRPNLGEDMILMLKLDGIYTKTKYDDEGVLRNGLSRGRSGNSMDFTKVMRDFVLPPLVDIERSTLVYGEAFVDMAGLSKLKDKYPNSGRYNTTKGGAISLLRTSHEADDYDNLTLLAFDAEGLADTKSATLDRLDELGFKTTPRILLKAGYFEDDIVDFEKKIKELMRLMWEKTEVDGITVPTDGLVIELDNKLLGTDSTNQYQDRNLALKFEYWSDVLYEGIVEDIIVENTRVDSSVRVKIKPLRTDDGNEARIINVYNLAVLQDNEIFVGSKVFFKRKGNSYNNLVYGEELKKIMEG